MSKLTARYKEPWTRLRAINHVLAGFAVCHISWFMLGWHTFTVCVGIPFAIELYQYFITDNMEIHWFDRTMDAAEWVIGGLLAILIGLIQ